jgi:hypothetical protein
LTKPEGWLPNPAIHLTLLALTYSNLFLVPFASNTPSLLNVTALTRILPLIPLTLPYILPERLGTVHNQPHATYSTYTTIFRTIAATSALLHFKSTVLALFYNTPESQYYRHSLLHPFKEEHRYALNRGYTAFGRVLSSVNEHPAVGAVGWDVMFSGLSLGIWAAIRGLEPMKMLSSTVPFMERVEPVVGEAEDTIKVEEEKVVQKYDHLFQSANIIKQIPTNFATRIEPSSPLPTRTRRGRPRKLATSIPELGNEISSVPTRRGGRFSKKSHTEDEEGDDASYQPTESDQLEEGDENAEEDWEVGALAWGLITAGGLGNGSAAVYGAEIMAR